MNFSHLQENEIFRLAVKKQHEKLSDPELTEERIVDRLGEIYHVSEKFWFDTIREKFAESGQKVQYILIGEAPPWHSAGIVSYFYNPDTPIISSRLLSTVYAAFFGVELKEANEISNMKKIESLCGIGFLLVDMLPLGFSYKSIGRSKLYSDLVEMVMSHLEGKLDGLQFLLQEGVIIRVAYKAQAKPLRHHLSKNHFAYNQVNDYDPINTNRFGTPTVKNITEGFGIR